MSDGSFGDACKYVFDFQSELTSAVESLSLEQAETGNEKEDGDVTAEPNEQATLGKAVSQLQRWILKRKCFENNGDLKYV